MRPDRCAIPGRETALPVRLHTLPVSVRTGFRRSVIRSFGCFVIAATLALACWSISPSIAQSDDANRLTKKVIELWQSRKFAEAIPLAQRALVIWEKQLGPHHRNVATALNNLALLYVGQSRYGDAEPLYKRSLSIREKALGPNHPDVAGAGARSS